MASDRTQAGSKPFPGEGPGTALERLTDAVKYAQKMGGAVPVTDALVQLIAAAVVEIGADRG